MSFENINGVSGNASGVPSSTSESFADMLKNVRLNGPTPLTSGGLNVPPPDGRGAVSSAPEAGLMPVTLRRPANAGGVGNEPGTAAHAASAGSSPYSSYLPPIKTQDNQGKTLPQYRMGTGQRILGTLANFASGFAGHGGSPVYVGPGALNNRYYRDEADREQQNQIAAQQNADHFRNEIDYRTIVEEPGTGRWKARTYGGEVRYIEAPPWATPFSQGQPNNKDVPGRRPGMPSFPSPPATQILQASQTIPPDSRNALGSNAGSQFPRSPARERFAMLRRGAPGSQSDYRFTAKHGQTNQLIGSHDGKNWEFIHQPDQNTSA